MSYVLCVKRLAGTRGGAPVVCSPGTWEEIKKQCEEHSEVHPLLIAANFRSSYTGFWHIFEPLLWFDNSFVRQGYWEEYFSPELDSSIPGSYGGFDYGDASIHSSE